MKEKIQLLLLAVIALFTGAILITAVNMENGDVDFQAGRYDEIAQKILDREVVEDTYLNFIEDEDLKEKIFEYNRLTANYTVNFTEYGMEIIIALCDLKNEEGEPLSTSALNHHLIPDRYTIMVEKIAQYALYRNATELILGDLTVAQVIAGEGGGSYGVWPYHIHYDGTIEPYGISTEELDDYFNLVDEVVLSLTAK